MQHDLTVFIVDDDPSVRDALSLLLGVRGYRTAMFASGEAFLQAWQPAWRGCMLIDIRMSGMDGLSLQMELRRRDCRIPVIIMSGHGDVSMARAAFKADAVDFLEKPVDDGKLIAAIDEALARARSVHTEQQRRSRSDTLLSELTPREREVMELVVMGRHNREIGPALGISVRTVEVHKARLMAKLGVDNVADLVRITMQD
ncbi:DNA-binding response regulator [Duganella sp. BJB488]|uniref:Response regulator n=1 Tax=Duganella vulcania TaxID=2692166 RepID=A0A845HMP3_9BURK|nr:MULTISPECIES: response regulator [Duganella]MYN20061.1 response regulator [Duganella vulcania]NVD69486.1 response regulator transcription factor [Duganella sp. BJB1802]RFP26170.1 DNA-binding response regulator [Duganella sp. BJB489]RFP28090.1 DNA-binding response regulator [Duganella sp. BJB488]RFP37098.1 DNA-binding response regulator [Duganella sp. BJB480]